MGCEGQQCDNKMGYYVLSPKNGSNPNDTSAFLAMSNGINGTAGESGSGDEGDGWIWDDATWILCASFIIFTMQTGENMS